MLRNRSPIPYQPFFASLEGLMVRRVGLSRQAGNRSLMPYHHTRFARVMMVRRVGFEPTVFTLRDWFYRPARDRHPRSRRVFIILPVGFELDDIYCQYCHMAYLVGDIVDLGVSRFEHVHDKMGCDYYDDSPVDAKEQGERK